MAPNKRRYQYLWELIRDGNGVEVTISCAPHLRRCIRKAIYKEKDIDSTFDKRRRLQCGIKRTGLVFRLGGIRLATGIYLQPSSGTERPTTIDITEEEIENEFITSATCNAEERIHRGEACGAYDCKACSQS